MSKNRPPNQTAVMANMIGQIGCVIAIVAIVIIALAFGVGWFIDDYMGNERRYVTILLLLGSFPITLYAMVRISLAMVGRAQERVQKLDQENKDGSLA